MIPIFESVDDEILILGFQVLKGSDEGCIL